MMIGIKINIGYIILNFVINRIDRIINEIKVLQELISIFLIYFFGFCLIYLMYILVCESVNGINMFIVYNGIKCFVCFLNSMMSIIEVMFKKIILFEKFKWLFLIVNICGIYWFFVRLKVSCGKVENFVFVVRIKISDVIFWIIQQNIFCLKVLEVICEIIVLLGFGVVLQLYVSIVMLENRIVSKMFIIVRVLVVFCVGGFLKVGIVLEMVLILVKVEQFEEKVLSSKNSVMLVIGVLSGV